MDGISLLFKVQLNKIHFFKQYCQVFIMDKNFRKNIYVKCPSLFGSRIVGEAFLKSLSILEILGQCVAETDRMLPVCQGDLYKILRWI